MEKQPDIPTFITSEGTQKEIIARTYLGPVTCHHVVEEYTNGELTIQNIYTMYDSQVGVVEIPEPLHVRKQTKEPDRNLPA